jgi:hypothetical protein
MLDDLIDDAVWESPRIPPTNIFGGMSFGIQKGVLRECIPHADDFLHKIRPWLLVRAVRPEPNEGHMKKEPDKSQDSELCSEYDFSHGVRGKYAPLFSR